MKRWTALAGLVMLGATVTANAAVSDEQFRQMQEKLDQALQRINELEKEGTEVSTAQQAEIDALAASAAASEASKTALVDQVAANTAKIETTMSWADRISIKGDFRYRYQYDDVADIDDPASANDTRNRNRIRARPEITAMLDPNLLVGFGLATGTDDDPTSSNQTLGNGGSDKDITVDLAYFTWTGVQDTTMTGGKFKNPLVTVGGSMLQWDGDWRPEGADIGWTNGTFFANALGNYLESDSNEDNGSTFATLLQTGANFELGPVAMTGGVGYTNINTEGKPCFFSSEPRASGFGSRVSLERGFCYGNQARGQFESQRYADDFGVFNLFAQGTFNIFDLPLAIHADYINNSDADDYETGYQAGLTLGSLKAAGEFQVGYYYQELESNATLGLLTNSDFGGGGTNGKGSVLSAGYALSDKTNLLATYYLVDKNTDKLASVNNGDDYSYDTLQLDLNFKYK